VGHDVPVRQHDALRVAHRSGCEQYLEKVARGDVPHRRAVCVLRGQALYRFHWYYVQEAGELAAYGFDAGRERPGGYERPARRKRHYEFMALYGGPRVERHGDGSDPREGEEGYAPLGPVLAEHGDVVAPFHAELSQMSRELRDELE